MTDVGHYNFNIADLLAMQRSVWRQGFVKTLNGRSNVEYWTGRWDDFLLECVEKANHDWYWSVSFPWDLPDQRSGVESNVIDAKRAAERTLLEHLRARGNPTAAEFEKWCTDPTGEEILKWRNQILDALKAALEKDAASDPNQPDQFEDMS